MTTAQEKTPKQRTGKPFVSIVLAGYNEAAILENSLRTICMYMGTLETEYAWELIFINDGSRDETGEIAEAFAGTRDNLFVFHHITNFRLGQALRYAFNNCRGDYIVTLDVDLSYSPDHIGKLLKKMRETRARIVIASPYMKEGKISNVPWLRRTLSRWANRYLSFSASESLTTITGMVRAYDGRFLRTLNLRAMDSEINEEIIYKAQMLRARVLEIPAHLNWGLQKSAGKSRRSSMKISRKVASCVASGFIFRPIMFFVVPGLLLFFLSIYPISWAMIHTLSSYQRLSATRRNLPFDYLFSEAVSEAFRQSPHSFLVGSLTLMLSLQLISLGILAWLFKRYFEELYHLGTSIYKSNRENETS